MSKIDQLIRHRFDGLDDLDKPLISHDLRYAQPHHIQSYFQQKNTLEMGELTMEGLQFPLVDGKNHLFQTQHTTNLFGATQKMDRSRMAYCHLLSVFESTCLYVNTFGKQWYHPISQSS